MPCPMIRGACGSLCIGGRVRHATAAAETRPRYPGPIPCHLRTTRRHRHEIADTPVPEIWPMSNFPQKTDRTRRDVLDPCMGSGVPCPSKIPKECPEQMTHQRLEHFRVRSMCSIGPPTTPRAVGPGGLSAGGGVRAGGGEPRKRCRTVPIPAARRRHGMSPGRTGRAAVPEPGPLCQKPTRAHSARSKTRRSNASQGGHSE